METVLKAIADWIKGILTAGIMSNLSGLFDDVNTQVGNIAQQVGTKPSSFEPRVFAMIEALSRNVVLPIAGIILTFIACYELIEMITQHNNMAQFEPALIMRWIFKTAVSVWLISNTFDIVMAVFDLTQKVVSDSSGIIAGNTRVNDIGLSMLEASLMQMDVGPLFGLFLQSFFIGITMRILSMGEPNVLTGKIYCADCGAPMYNHRQRKGRERIYYTTKGEKRISHSNPADCYECSTYNLAYQKYDRHCTCHHISTKALKSIILKTIQETCHYVSLNEQEFVYSLQEESAMKDIAVSETVKKRIERNQKRVHELDMLIRKIYEDNVIGRLPDRLFQSMLTDYENEQNELNKIIETDTADMQRIIGGQNNVERFLKLVKKYENITELTPAMINEFIDKILVHEPQGKGADRTTEVEIYLNYVGQFQVPVEQHEPTEEERIAAEKEAERLRRKRESNRKYMKKIREKSKKFAEHERIAEEKSSDSNVCVEQNATSKSNRQKVKGEKIA